MTAPGHPRVYLKDESFEPPTDPIYYLLAADGLFKVLSMPLYSATVRVDGGVRGLCKQEEDIDLKLPPLPRRLMERAVGFFVAAYKEHRCESILLLHYHPERRRYRLVAPLQRISVTEDYWGRRWTGMDVKYTHVPPEPGWRAVGDIHSHGAQPAFQSVQDAIDATDGLHIVVGSLNWKVDFDAVFTIGGQRVKLDFDEVCEGYRKPKLPAPAVWLDQIEADEYATTTLGAENGGYHGDGCAYSDPYAGPDGRCDGFGKLPD